MENVQETLRLNITAEDLKRVPYAILWVSLKGYAKPKLSLQRKLRKRSLLHLHSWSLLIVKEKFYSMGHENEW